MSAPAITKTNTIHTMACKVLLPLTLLLAAWFAYDQGTAGILFFDDHANLSKLAQLKTTEDRINFILDGTSGPLGRPISLASFLFHADGWPDSAKKGLQLNIAIHFANAALLLLLGILLIKHHGTTSPTTTYYISLSAAALWLLMPILASTSLILVQRMTSLSALFGLVGLVGYAWGYNLTTSRPRLSLVIQFSTLGIGTLLSILSKENGALIPIYALVIESLIMKEKDIAKPYRTMRIRILSTALLLLATYLLIQTYNTNNDIELNRGFTVIDRVKTESIIVWKYIHLIFFPSPNSFGPFHDDIQVIHGLLEPTLSAVCLFSLLLLFWIVRTKYVWPLFATIWFLIGHLIESTTVMLELYYEHRNYIASYGICLMLSYSAFSIPIKYRAVSVFGLVAYGLSVYFSLYVLTSTWGNPALAYQSWIAAHPLSSRAAMAQSHYYYQASGNSTASINILDSSLARIPNSLDIHTQAIVYACPTESGSQIQKRIEQLNLVAKAGRATPATLDNIQTLIFLVENNYCGSLGMKHIQATLAQLGENSFYTSTSNAIFLDYLSAVVAKKLQQYELAYFFLNRIESRRDIYAAIQLKVELLLEAGLRTEAIQLLQSKRKSVNIGHISAHEWQSAIDQLSFKFFNATHKYREL